MKKALLIINPTSGGEKALDYREKLEDKAGQYFDHVETKITQKAKDATEFAKQASEEGYQVLPKMNTFQGWPLYQVVQVT